MVYNIYRALLAFSIAASSICLNSHAENVNFRDGSVAVLRKIVVGTDFFNYTPFSHIDINGKRVIRNSDSISATGITPDGSQIKYTCGLMSYSDPNGTIRLARVPSIDSYTIAKKLPSGEILSMSLEGVPNDNGGEAGPHELFRYVLASMSDGKSYYYEFAGMDSTQACASPKPGGKDCNAINAFLLGGTPIRLMGWGMEGCDALVKRQNLNAELFTRIGSDQARLTLAKRVSKFLSSSILNLRNKS